LAETTANSDLPLASPPLSLTETRSVPQPASASMVGRMKKNITVNRRFMVTSSA